MVEATIVINHQTFSRVEAIFNRYRMFVIFLVIIGKISLSSKFPAITSKIFSRLNLETEYSQEHSSDYSSLKATGHINEVNETIAWFAKIRLQDKRVNM